MYVQNDIINNIKRTQKGGSFMEKLQVRFSFDDNLWKKQKLEATRKRKNRPLNTHYQERGNPLLIL